MKRQIYTYEATNYVECYEYLDGLNGIFNLEQPTFWGEGINTSIVLGPLIKTPKNRSIITNTNVYT